MMFINIIIKNDTDMNESGMEFIRILECFGIFFIVIKINFFLGLYDKFAPIIDII